MLKLIKRFKNDESGATAIEYGLIAALIALAIMVGASSLGGALNAKFKLVADCVKDPKASGCPT
ncbi:MULTISPECIES: Flp family type IVb pilin [unclassified Mesorhizobium]|jgi:pilus assembly protein Flp/PilA|uniref:Flp family type IVb pilin n=1 Tax=unclassified Mesorhizobium TaxID=325217 RepID=UPI000FD87996|nr:MULTISPECIES: Flp family type IVb pilin [unclassified Mesorhizobium]TGQ07834.1 Flp family type IVb pilin [Mesorhizobium sp. M2E.F.Ca.ET.219.01.1.1]TGS09731.1 Flp family type IVb pilin [Mesorhizobium sp. M2E.F.Ca.ET.209.01.1.1]TGT73855.1 Flp family type IVb pilin [Mesorhizobium sp. M2E.F.Ca.ET.166.01.1.1]TGW00369.1 Flp family type IVb pilin [Mesorhizobium sp. M2E.F.Ca.ET.154.01.1.1]